MTEIDDFDEHGNRIIQPDPPPLYIFLQWHGDGDGNWPETEYGRDVTWSKSRVYDQDIVYIRVGKSFAAALLAAMTAVATVEHS